jgi:hypothetical protein
MTEPRTFPVTGATGREDLDLGRVAEREAGRLPGLRTETRSPGLAGREFHVEHDASGAALGAVLTRRADRQRPHTSSWAVASSR